MQQSFYARLKKHFNDFFSRQYYRTLYDLPHQRVLTTNNDVFDLFNLGLFNNIECVELVVLQPQADYPLHYHQHSRATIFIIKGSGYFRLGDERLPYQGREKIHVPAKIAHGFVTQTLTLFLSIQSPPILQANGEMDLYYVEQSHG